MLLVNKLNLPVTAQLAADSPDIKHYIENNPHPVKLRGRFGLKYIAYINTFDLYVWIYYVNHENEGC